MRQRKKNPPEKKTAPGSAAAAGACEVPRDACPEREACESGARSAYPVFTEEMKRTHTILVPNMLPMHFRMFLNIFRAYGYKAELLTTTGKRLADLGLRYVHNDTCYPALLVIGQFLDALSSGKYDPHKVALLISQTGGGCRASNYIHLLRKALERAGYGYVPVISFNVVGTEKSAFRLTLGMLYRMMYAALYGDLLMSLNNQVRSHERRPGESSALAERWTDRLTGEMARPRNLNYHHVKENYRKILADFARIEVDSEEKPKIGIVGEIFVKFSPLGNNNLEKLLLENGAEPVMPGLVDFCLYSVFDGIWDTHLYRLRRVKGFFCKILLRFLMARQEDLIKITEKESRFAPVSSFREIRDLAGDYINYGAKMGEGWLLTGEMLELLQNGARGVICAQPFGCLPNHIVGKGMMKQVKERNPGANIIAVDYDPGATAVNQENRIKLLLARCREQMAQERAAREEGCASEEQSPPSRAPENIAARAGSRERAASAAAGAASGDPITEGAASAASAEEGQVREGARGKPRKKNAAEI